MPTALRPSPALAREQELLEALDPEQRQVVLHERGPLLVLAGAGSGKTRAITHRVAHLVACRGVRGGRICTLTFTNRAARELLQRVRELAGPAGGSVLCATFHAFAVRMLRRIAPVAGRSPSFVVYDERDQAELLRQVADGLGLQPGRRPLAGVRAWLGRVKSSGLPPEAVPGPEELTPDVLLAIAEAYEQALRRSDAFDFGDLILRLAEALEEHPGVRATLRGLFEHVLVDEYQDTSPTQERLLRGLVAPGGDLVVVGDDDQAIYAWRGATADNILTFADRWPGTRTVRLERNYRSRPEVLEAADAVIEHAEERLGKVLRAQRPPGGQVEVRTFVSGRDEARGVAAMVAEHLGRTGNVDGFAIFYRAKWMSSALETELRTADLPHRVLAGFSFYDRQEVQDLLAHARFLCNPFDTVAAVRALRRPRRGVGPVTLAALAKRALDTGGDWMEATRAEVRRGTAAGRRLAKYLDAMEPVQARLPDISPAEALEELAEASGINAWLQTLEAEDTEQRTAHLMELRSSARDLGLEHPNARLPRFLQQLSLGAEEPSADDGTDSGFVSLLTLHAAKGLEFDTVVVVGMEEGVMPNARNLDADEERRLCYVGFTRAKERLVLTHAWSRLRFGSDAAGGPSRYLEELPASVRWAEPPSAWGRPRLPPAWRQDPALEARAAVEAIERRVQRPQAGSQPPPDEFDQRPPPGWDDTDGGGGPPRPGTLVRHPSFGEGEVVSAHGSGPTLKLGVRFPFRGVKRVLIGHLEILNR